MFAQVGSQPAQLEGAASAVCVLAARAPRRRKDRPRVATRTRSQCLFCDRRFWPRASYNADSWKLEGAASAEADDCLKLAIKYLMSSKEFSDVEQGAPSPAPGQPVFAMSYYFDVAEDIGLIAKGRQEAKLHPADYSMKRKVICGRSKSELQMLLPNADSERVAFLCTDLSFIEALLINGFKLDPEAQMTLAKSITCVQLPRPPVLRDCGSAVQRKPASTPFTVPCGHRSPACSLMHVAYLHPHAPSSSAVARVVAASTEPVSKPSGPLGQPSKRLASWHDLTLWRVETTSDPWGTSCALLKVTKHCAWILVQTTAPPPRH